VRSLLKNPEADRRSACPHLVVLPTSRERLNLDGEVVWRLSPLALPQTADTFAIASATESVRLFVDRARNVSPGFEIRPDNLPAIVAICRRLDGMPLAIELETSDGMEPLAVF
jgi:predicted ATPase